MSSGYQISGDTLHQELRAHGKKIAMMEGKWESLATKEFVRTEIAALRDHNDAQTKDLSDKIAKLTDWRNRMIGIGLAVAIAVNLIVGVTVGVIVARIV